VFFRLFLAKVTGRQQVTHLFGCNRIFDADVGFTCTKSLPVLGMPESGGEMVFLSCLALDGLSSLAAQRRPEKAEGGSVFQSSSQHSGVPGAFCAQKGE